MLVMILTEKLLNFLSWVECTVIYIFDLSWEDWFNFEDAFLPWDFMTLWNLLYLLHTLYLIKQYGTLVLWKNLHIRGQPGDFDNWVIAYNKFPWFYRSCWDTMKKLELNPRLFDSLVHSKI